MALQGNTVAPPDTSAPLPGGNAAMALALSGQTDLAAPAVAKADPFSNENLLKFHKEAHAECFDGRSQLERVWWRNILYALGRQWIYYDVGRGAWLDKRLAKWVPRPVTNKVIEGVETLTSTFQGVQLGVTCRPNGNDPRNTQTAETADKLSPALHSEHEMDRVFRTADFWTTVTGNAFLFVWMDKECEQGSFVYQYEECAGCGTVVAPHDIAKNANACPECGAQAFSPAENEQGEPIGDELSEGRGRTDALGPLEVAFPLDLPSFDVTPYVGRLRFRSKRWCKNHLPTEMFEKLTFEKSASERSLQMARSLSTAADMTVSPSALTEGTESEQSAEGITEIEWWVKPSKDFPEGAVFRVIGEGGQSEIVPYEAEGIPGPLPLQTPKGKRVFPWTHHVYEEFAGRMIGRAPIDRVVQIQDSINKIDSMMEMSAMRMSNPVWLEPKGSEVKKFSGEPGLVIKYNPLMAAGNAKPERIEGSNIPPTLIRMREQKIADFESAMGTQDALKGVKPAGVEAFSALQLLVERAQSRLGQVFTARGEAYRKWFSIALEQERAWGPRERVWAVMSPNQTWTYELFSAADLEGDVTVLVEDGSQSPKTNLGMRAAVQQLVTMQMVKADNPNTVYEVLKMFGQTNLLPEMNIAVKSALEQQDALMRWAQDPMQSQPMPQMGVDPMTGQPLPPMFAVPPPIDAKKWHNWMIHALEHKKFCNSDQVRQLLKQRSDLEPVFVSMIEVDEQMMVMDAQKQAMMSAMMAAPPAGPGGGSSGPGSGGGGQAMAAANAAGGTGAVPSGNSQAPATRGPE